MIQHGEPSHELLMAFSGMRADGFLGVKWVVEVLDTPLNVALCRRCSARPLSTYVTEEGAAGVLSSGKRMGNNS